MILKCKFPGRHNRCPRVDGKFQSQIMTYRICKGNAPEQVPRNKKKSGCGGDWGENLWKHFFVEICCQAKTPFHLLQECWNSGGFTSFTSTLVRGVSPDHQRAWHLFSAVGAENWSCTSFWESLTWPLAGRQGWLFWDWPAFPEFIRQGMFEGFLRINQKGVMQEREPRWGHTRPCPIEPPGGM